jgi:hypothetical protein
MMRMALAAIGLLVMASSGFGGDEVAAVRRDMDQLIDATREERRRLDAECDGHVTQLMADVDRQKGTGEELTARKAALDRMRALHAVCVEKRHALAQAYESRKEALIAKLPADQRVTRPEPTQMTSVDAAP